MIVWIIASLQFKSSKYAKRLSLLLIKSHGKVVQYLEKTFQSAYQDKNQEQFGIRIGFKY